MKNFKKMSKEEKMKALADSVNESTGGVNPLSPLYRARETEKGQKGWNLPIGPTKPDPERDANMQIDNAVSGRDMNQMGSDLNRILAPTPERPSLLKQIDVQAGEIPVENPDALSEEEQSRASRLQWLQQKRMQGQ